MAIGEMSVRAQKAGGDAFTPPPHMCLIMKPFRLASGWNRLRDAPESNGLVAFRFSGALPAERALSNAFYAIRETTLGQPGGPRFSALPRPVQGSRRTES